MIAVERTRGLIVVDRDSLELQVRGPAVDASGVNAVLLRYYLPELRTIIFTLKAQLCCKIYVSS